MDREAAIAQLLEAEIYEYIHNVNWWIANVNWSIYTMDELLVRVERVKHRLETILSETD